VTVSLSDPLCYKFLVDLFNKSNYQPENDEAVIVDIATTKIEVATNYVLGFSAFI